MIIEVTNVYNTKREKANLSILMSEMERDVEIAKQKILEIDKSVEITSRVYDVDWSKFKRGQDARASMFIRKKGRKITLNKIASILNSTFKSPCYFNTKKLKKLN